MKIFHGIDLVDSDRIEFDNINIYKKILHKDEINKYHISNDKKKFLASRWAIKEAIFKAIEKKVSINNINIFYENSRPKCIVGDIHFIISLSYEKKLIVASVIGYK